MKKVARLRVTQDDQFVPPGVKINAAEQPRTTGRIKKPKAVFDPSDNYMPRSHRLSLQSTIQNTTPPGKSPVSAPISPTMAGIRRERSLSTGSNTSSSSITLNNDICFVCSKREPRRGGNYRNKLISCTECNKRVHKLCMSVDFYESAPVRLNYKCDICRTCEACSDSANVNAITCAKCCKSYHLECHAPKLSKIYLTERHWKCAKCNPTSNDANVAIKPNNDTAGQMPVKIIRQIIGDNVNLNSVVQKTEQTAIKKEARSQSQSPQKPKVQGNSQEHKKISEATAEVRAKAAEFSQSSSDSITSTSSSSSDDSEDEDYKVANEKKPRIKIENNNNQDSNSKASALQPAKQLEEVAPKKITNELPKREEVRSWTVDQVEAYIAEQFPDEAHVFKEQEIDGNALLLLKRSDVVQKLPIKLGPSLRLYNLILKVQTQTANDPTLGWDCSIDTLLPSTD